MNMVNEQGISEIRTPRSPKQQLLLRLSTDKLISQ